MLIDFHLGQTSVILRVKIKNSSVSTGAGLTGLTFSSSGLKIAAIADNESATTAYTAAGSTIETITTLGTYAAPTATKCRFKEVDATNHPGVYEIQIADARFAVASAKSLLITISGATNAAECDALIPLRSVDPYSATFGIGTAMENQIWDAATTNHNNTVANTFGALLNLLYRNEQVATGVINDTSPTASSFKIAAIVELGSPDFTDCIMILKNATFGQEQRVITGYNVSTGLCTFDEAFSGTPSNGDVIRIKATHAHSKSQIATAIWQDITAGDFTVSGSIGKSLAPSTLGTPPGSAGGLPIVGSQMDLVNAPNATALTAIGTAVDTATVASHGAGSYVRNTEPDNTSITAIKAKTDSLTFTVAGKADSTVAGYATGMNPGIAKNTALPGFEFKMVDSADHITPKTGLTVTAQKSIDGSVFTSCTNSPAEVANGVYKIDLAAADLNGRTITLRFSSTGADDTTIELITSV